MTIALDRTLRIGTLAIAAIVNRSTSCRSIGAAAFRVAKHPVAILVHHDGAITAFDLDGSPIAKVEAKKRFPGLVAAFESQAHPSC